MRIMYKQTQLLIMYKQTQLLNSILMTILSFVLKQK